MSGYSGPRRPTRDFFKRYAQLEERVRRLEINHGKVHAEALTFSVLGDITVGMPLCPQIHSALDGQYRMRPGEQKSVVGIKGMCGIDGAGASTVTFKVGWWGRYETQADYSTVLNPTTLNCANRTLGGVVLPDPNAIQHWDPDDYTAVNDGDALAVQITAVTGLPANLSIAVIVVTGTNLSPNQAGSSAGKMPWS